ncbi:MAG: hypothetical protein EOP48_01370 [Sphingobacteriales bacterium]|nr:MAG: hypothetical protein EOP48_01370 [Sphingobacteriales bacterium]
MKNEKEKRKRFNKPYHFLTRGKNQPAKCLAEVFQHYHLDDFREEIETWEQLALSSGLSIYDEGAEREDLIDFVQGLHRLVEAFLLLNTEINGREIGRTLKSLSEDARKLISEMNVPVALTSEQKENPRSVIKQFTQRFKQSYAELELLDLLDAVVTYDGDKEVHKVNLVLFYQHLNYLIKLAYTEDL